MDICIVLYINTYIKTEQVGQQLGFTCILQKVDYRNQLEVKIQVYTFVLKLMKVNAEVGSLPDYQGITI